MLTTKCYKCQILLSSHYLVKICVKCGNKTTYNYNKKKKITIIFPKLSYPIYFDQGTTIDDICKAFNVKGGRLFNIDRTRFFRSIPEGPGVYLFEEKEILTRWQRFKELFCEYDGPKMWYNETHWEEC
jgi:hypothetical protein